MKKSKLNIINYFEKVFDKMIKQVVIDNEMKKKLVKNLKRRWMK